MKILFLTHNLKQDNGGGVFSFRVIRGIAMRFQAEAVIFTSVPSDASSGIARLNPFKIVQTFLNIRRAAKRCAVIHSFDVFPYGIVAALASLGLRKKHIITAIGSGSILPLHRPLLAYIARWCFWRADAVIAISKFTRDEIIKKIPSLAVRVINPGIQWEEYAKAANLPPPEKVLTMRPYIISVGTIRWRKGYKRSIRAFAEVSKKFPQLTYVIIGKRHSENFFQELKRIIYEFDLQEKVVFVDSLDSRDELLQWYRGAELFCLFSENVNHDVEGFGIVFLEAAACGLPVVGVKNCGVEDAVEDGKNGILIGSREPKEFADAIIKILGNSLLRDSMKKESVAWAEGFGWARKIDEYEEVYKRLQ